MKHQPNQPSDPQGYAPRSIDDMPAATPEVAAEAVPTRREATAQARAALQDLLAVTQLSQVTPARIQEWQAAARTLLQ